MAGMKLGLDLVSFLLGMLGLEEGWGAGDASVPRMLGKHFPQAGIGFVNVFWQEMHGLMWYDFWDIILTRILDGKEQ